MNRYIINVLKKVYQHEKRMMREGELGIRSRSRDEIETSFMIITRMEMAADMLDETSRLIIVSEVFENKNGCWYNGLFSTASYYRYCKKAYALFIDELKR